MSVTDYSLVLLERLHASLQVVDVVGAIEEVLINLIGSEDFALFVRDDDTRRFEQLMATGARATRLPGFATGEGPFGAAAAAVTIRYGKESAAVVPLLSGRRAGSVGVAVIETLLAHKPGLSADDRKLLELLSRHAGLALEAAICAEQAPQRVCKVARLREQFTAVRTATWGSSRL